MPFFTLWLILVAMAIVLAALALLGVLALAAMGIVVCVAAALAAIVALAMAIWLAVAMRVRQPEEIEIEEMTPRDGSA